MLSASRVLSRADAGEPLPTVFRSLDARGIKPRRGQITMIAGQTNAGKSMWALFYAIRLAQAGERVLYFSADSDEHTQGTRMAAAMSGDTTASIEDAVRVGSGLAYYEDFTADIDIRFDFNDAPSMDDIDLTMAAYDETFGDWPTVVILDNLVNLEGFSDGDASEKHGMVQIQRVLKHICRTTKAAVLLLHHCLESEGKPHLPPIRKAVSQKVNEIPENILTIAYDPEQERFGVAAVKLRNGRADPMARNPVWLYADMDRCRFGDSKYDLLVSA